MAKKPQPEVPVPGTITEAEFRKALKELERRRVYQKIDFFEPYSKQKDFCNSTAEKMEVALQAGNQVGKSEIGAYVAAVFATGLYPPWWEGRRFDGPTLGWVCGESAVAVRDVAQRKLCGPAGDEAMFGSGMIPKNKLLGKAMTHGVSGAIDSIKIKHVSGGTSEIAFKSYDQDRGKWQGATLHWIWCDEEPPVDHYMEALARLTATSGVVFSTFTPLNGNNLILPRFYERNPEATRNRQVIRMRPSDAAHMTEERQKVMLAAYPSHQRRARIEGLPLLGSGAVFEEVELEHIVAPLRWTPEGVVHATHGLINTDGWSFLWAVDFGISHPFAAVLLAWDKDADTIYVLAEVKITGGVPAIHASRMRALAPDVKVAWPHDGTQRDKGSGEQLAAIYRREKLLMLPTHATFEHGGYSTEAGIMELLTRMRSGRFKVAQSCIEWQEEFSGYHRKDGLIVKTNDDLLSATRIGVMQRRSAKPMGEYRRGYSQPVKIAAGVETNLWGMPQ